MIPKANTLLALAAKQAISLQVVRTSAGKLSSTTSYHEAQRDLDRALFRLKVEADRVSSAYRPECLQCGLEKRGDAGDHYHGQECFAKYLRAWIADRPGTEDEEAMLRRHLDMAQEVGD